MTKIVNFKKEVIIDRIYKGSKEIRWYFNNTKYLPSGYAIKESYCWNCYDNEDNLLTRFDYCSRLHSKKDVIEWIINYDEYYEYQLEKEKEEKIAEKNEYLTRKMLENALTNSFKQHYNDSHTLNVDEFIDLHLCNISKPCNIGEAILYGTRKVRGKIAKLIKLNNNEYDELITSFYSAKRELFNSRLGGNFSDDERLEGYTFNNILHDNKLKKIWEETNYELLHAIISDNRKTLYVNTQGYEYIRYIGY